MSGPAATGQQQDDQPLDRDKHRALSRPGSAPRHAPPPRWPRATTPRTRGTPAPRRRRSSGTTAPSGRRRFAKVSDDLGVLLAGGSAGIQLCPLDAAVITDYLGGPPDSATQNRWQPVLATLTAYPPPPVAHALSTPLMVSLAKDIYHPWPDEHIGALPNPAELSLV